MAAALEHAKRRGATGAIGALGHSAGAATALKVPNAKGAVAIAGFGRDAVADCVEINQCIGCIER